MSRRPTVSSFPFGLVRFIPCDYPTTFKYLSGNTVTDCRARTLPCTLIQKNDNRNCSRNLCA
ncbi:hypothetical protein BIFBRE_03643 [Bifidobacterium breve DSM 20213 = JCM 1192]|uniref:Uncharacterized protein n=1 Tax=Bifidobacterium breve DSM 20213 = JCM 1192 TaxID=518634 RepID=D4BNJ2_BIFBR|nr:hypothetical protein BIFBRE_03643 [Bifidobacterium breve DSM 20213 = JCM 1192]